jgi:hypothetical protein
MRSWPAPLPERAPRHAGRLVDMFRSFRHSRHPQISDLEFTALRRQGARTGTESGLEKDFWEIELQLSPVLLKFGGRSRSAVDLDMVSRKSINVSSGIGSRERLCRHSKRPSLISVQR